MKKNKNPKRKDGTELVRGVIDEKETCTIKISKGRRNRCWVSREDGCMSNDGIPGKGSDAEVWLDPTDPGLKALGIPLFLALGHELIHAQRGMRGIQLDTGPEVEYKVDGKTHTAFIEELVVTGIWTQNPNNPYRVRITENSLRKENGLAARKTYKY